MEQLPNYKYFAKEKEEKISNKLFFKFVIILFSIYAIIFGVVFVYHANFEYVKINGGSMQPTLNNNPTEINGEDVQDGVYIKVTDRVDYGDIVVISTNKQEDESIIKRALAFGGDYVTIASVEYDGTRDYRFMRVKKGSDEVEIIYEDYIKSYDYWNMIEGEFVNDVEYEGVLYSNFIYLEYQTKTFSVELDGEQRNVVFFEVPENDIFYMGDNRTGSRDARSTGTKAQKDVLGYVVRVVHNGTIIKQNPVKWFFHSVGDFFSIIWREIMIFFGANV